MGEIVLIGGKDWVNKVALAVLLTHINAVLVDFVPLSVSS